MADIPEEHVATPTAEPIVADDAAYSVQAAPATVSETSDACQPHSPDGPQFPQLAARELRAAPAMLRRSSAWVGIARELACAERSEQCQ